MKCFFQLISRVNGVRSPVAGDDRQSFANNLRELFPEGSEDFVLVLVDDATASQWEFSRAPLMTINSFIKQFATEVQHG